MLDDLKFEISVVLAKKNLNTESSIKEVQEGIIEFFSKEYSLDQIEDMLILMDQETKIPDFDNLELPRFLVY